MKTNLKPSIYVKDIFSINYEKLKNQGIKTLLFDIDNTIATTKEKYPNNKVKELFDSLKKDNFNVYIISNALKHRALRFGEALDVKTYYFSAKPLKRQYIKIYCLIIMIISCYFYLIHSSFFHILDIVH